MSQSPPVTLLATGGTIACTSSATGTLVPTRTAGELVRDAGLGEASHGSLSRWIRASAPLAEWEAAWQDLEPAARVKRMENLLQLTLPGMMGERFRVLEAWGPPKPASQS